MVFSTTTLFKGIPCPEGEKCRLTNCIFAHDLRKRDEAQPDAPTQAREEQTQKTAAALDEQDEPPSKRRRVVYDKPEEKPPSRADQIRDQLAETKSYKPSVASQDAEKSSNGAKVSPASLTRTVSPPAKTNETAGKPASADSVVNKPAPNDASSVRPKPMPQKVSLNPRLIANDPVGHASRTRYLKLLHEMMANLNKGLHDRAKTVQFKDAFLLSENEVVLLAVEEEEKIATVNGKVYANVIKNRIGAYKKMTNDSWIEHLKSLPLVQSKLGMVQKQGPGQPDRARPVETGLTPEEELAILPHLVVKDQTPLAQFDYVTTPPTAEQAAEAAAAVEASKNYEVCERCSARFQIFPHRNNEGQVTTNGPCRHHPLRKAYPQRTKADTGPKEPYHPCCQALVGSLGCTESEHHVFKTSTPARMAAVLPFVSTPANDQPRESKSGQKVGAVAFDCEMGYTTLGMEVIRVTAVVWPTGEELLDILVRPLGIVLDLNSRFSGVFPEDITNAIPYFPTTEHNSPSDPSSSSSPQPLPIVASPQEARTHLLTYLTTSTPLIGHAIENDLSAIRLCHPTIIDTVLCFPHPRRGLPMRLGLRHLAEKFLQRAIQQGGPERGHDSLEDARATGDLVRVKVREVWRRLRGEGWGFGSIGDGAWGLVGPEQEVEKGRRKRKRERGGDGVREFEEKAVEGAGGGGSGEHRLTEAYLEDGK
ncbi:hypothetical protein KC332_g13527 [Hortaea werneckii]|uniref:Exonuclease domain-containing protein n=2 Tax=Hortaea werneckii TaxID=91943 RepID=A0A3M7IBX4_HORWE|nr:hypothetical protein KC358_g15498 [Hortaea werneckii]OTA37798.1 hypothetical protein BTJ68_01906 [Hortaea werneckii EXF-2000]KAI6824281.1 hypothetical protein KC350_g9028 [Hortaea werneckii]KAI6921997.1 hypothetical protein KC348_g9936 [Hortaea werneckii]KAI6925716.1 hypothetical protein KC341_g13205 [Hortaea werneckii]